MSYVWYSYSHFHKKAIYLIWWKKSVLLKIKGMFYCASKSAILVEKSGFFSSKIHKNGGVFRTWVPAWYTFWSGMGGLKFIKNSSCIVVSQTWDHFPSTGGQDLSQWETTWHRSCLVHVFSHWFRPCSAMWSRCCKCRNLWNGVIYIFNNNLLHVAQTSKFHRFLNSLNS